MVQRAHYPRTGNPETQLKGTYQSASTWRSEWVSRNPSIGSSGKRSLLMACYHPGIILITLYYFQGSISFFHHVSDWCIQYFTFTFFAYSTYTVSHRKPEKRSKLIISPVLAFPFPRGVSATCFLEHNDASWASHPEWLWGVADSRWSKSPGERQRNKRGRVTKEKQR